MLYFKIVYSFERLLVCVYTSQYCLSGCSHLGAFITNTNILYHAHKFRYRLLWSDNATFAVCCHVSRKLIDFRYVFRPT